MIGRENIFTVKQDTYFKLILLFSLIHSTISFYIVADNESGAVGNASYQPQSSDLEGRKVKASEELPYVVMVVTTAVGQMPTVCTGTQITINLVFTLATCLLVESNNYPDPDTINIYERPPEKHNILRALTIFINPNYYLADRKASRASNFALIVTERSKQRVAYPRLPEKMADFEDIKPTGEIAGFGDVGTTYVSNYKAIPLNETGVEVGQRCKNEREFCLHFKKIIPCAEDRGGPIVCNGTLYALYDPRRYPLVMTNDCYDVYFTTFTAVYNVKDWVQQIMEVPTSSFEWLNNPWYVVLICCAVFGVMGAIYYGLVELLQRMFDPADMLQIQIRLSREEELPYTSPWARGSD